VCPWLTGTGISRTNEVPDDCPCFCRLMQQSSARSKLAESERFLSKFSVSRICIDEGLIWGAMSVVSLVSVHCVFLIILRCAKECGVRLGLYITDMSLGNTHVTTLFLFNRC
jgi:hypothetical protein